MYLLYLIGQQRSFFLANSCNGEAVGETSTVSSNGEGSPPATNPSVGSIARDNSTSEETTQVDPTAQAEAFLQEHGQMCRAHWKEARRNAQREENMGKRGCLVETSAACRPLLPL